MQTQLLAVALCFLIHPTGITACPANFLLGFSEEGLSFLLDLSLCLCLSPRTEGPRCRLDAAWHCSWMVLRCGERVCSGHDLNGPLLGLCSVGGQHWTRAVGG
jgi:hypothetical protein